MGIADRTTEFTGTKTVRYVDASATQTRDCFDPWRIAFVNAEASVRPCCFFEESLGTLLDQSLPEIVEGDAYRKLREEIVTGELRPNCRSCSARPLIDRAEFGAKLTNYLAVEEWRKLGKL